ncbi:MAG: DPP IV N-terminal domain-containing protein, partial [Anaerolinea sp.]|nr:DPP IV N-terminal domain-containing protein [Anaerolinea sp.]
QRTLPPTFTPTATFTPSSTPTATETPLPLSSFRILYTEYIDNAPVPALFSARADGSQVQALGGGEGYSAIAIAPDGRQIAFVRGPLSATSAVTPDVTEAAGAPATLPAARRPQVYLAALDDVNGSARPITQMTGSRLAFPSWSPDGTRVAFASDQDGDFELYVISTGGSDLRQLTSNTALDTAPAWSPDGTTLIYTSDIDSPGFTEIYRIEIATGLITRLTDRSGNSYAPAWSPDGTRIAYVNDAGGDGDIFVMDADGQRPFLLTVDDGGAEDALPVWLPDGRSILFLSNRGGGINFQPFVVDLNGRVQRAFTTAGSLESLRVFDRE